jgi:RiboL-PSP-HEPN
MDSTRLETQCLAEIEWRVRELTVLKTLPLKTELTDKQREIALKFAIPNIYSTWEGYVKAVIRIYINELNGLNLQNNELHNKLLAHSIDMKYPQLTTGVRNTFIDKCDFIDELYNFIDKPVSLAAKLPTESNINWKVINNILERFNLQLLPESPYQSQLNYLLDIRNSVAHGDTNRPITQLMIDANANNVVNLMDKVMFSLLEGCKLQSYKR